MATPHPPTLRILARYATSAVASHIFGSSMSLTAHLAFSSAASRDIADCGSTGSGLEPSGEEEERRKVVDHVAGFWRGVAVGLDSLQGLVGRTEEVGNVVEVGENFFGSPSVKFGREEEDRRRGEEIRTERRWDPRTQGTCALALTVATVTHQRATMSS
jgi:hypothetical protein